MRSAVGNSYLLYIVLFFATAVILIFASILSYSKAYRVKNRIVDMLEGNKYVDIKDKIEDELKQYGYKAVSNINCKKYFNRTCTPENGLNTSGYNYCICKHEETDEVIYYEVVTFGQLEFPIIDSIFTFAIHGETKPLNKAYNYD